MRGILERGEHRVEASGETAELVAAARVDATGEVARLGDLFRGLRQPSHGRQRCAGDREAEARGNQNAAAGDQEEEKLDPRQRVIGCAQRPGDLDRVARDGLVLEGDDSNVVSERVRVEEKRFAIALRDGQDVVRDRQDARRRKRAAVSAHDLSRASDDAELRIREAGNFPWRHVRQEIGASPEVVVYRAVELALDHEVDDERRGDHRERDRRRGHEDEPGAKAHFSRRAYPTPRMVWINRDLPPASVLRRR